MFPPICPRPTNPTLVLVAAISITPFDGCSIVVAELEVGCLNDGIHLVGPAEADDRPIHGAVPERPGNRHRTYRRPQPLGHRLEALDGGEVPRELRLLAADVAPAPVPVGQLGDPLA